MNELALTRYGTLSLCSDADKPLTIRAAVKKKQKENDPVKVPYYRAAASPYARKTTRFAADTLVQLGASARLEARASSLGRQNETTRRTNNNESSA